MYHFFISDKSNIYRREHVRKQCDKIGLKPIFFDAIMGKDLSKEELNAVTSDYNYLTEGEIGCALSHINVLHTFLSTDERCVAVFEDDIIFSKHITLELLQGFKSFVESKKKPTVLALYSSELYYSKDVNVDGVTIYRTPRFMGTYAYIMNREAAEAICTLQNEISIEIDQFKYYQYLKGCRLYMLDRNCVGVDKENIISEISKISSLEDNENYRGKLRDKNINLLLCKLSVYERILYIARKLKKHILAKKMKSYKPYTELW